MTRLASAFAFLSLFGACSSGAEPTALTELTRRLDDGRAEPSTLWAEPHWQALRDDPATRPRLRELLRRHPRPNATMVAAGEPGQRLAFDGRVVDAQDQPVAAALVYLYQADAAGRYSPEAARPGEGDGNPRLFAWLLTDAEGRFTLATILPGSYGGAPPHFHLGVSRSTDRAARGQRIYFEGDWPMDPEVYDDARGGHAFVCRVADAGGGRLRAAATVRMR